MINSLSYLVDHGVIQGDIGEVFPVEDSRHADVVDDETAREEITKANALTRLALVVQI